MIPQQETFNTVVLGIVKQGGPSRKPLEEPMTGSCCRYRDDEGRKCAIGQIIPDELYDPAIEGAVLWESGQSNDDERGNKLAKIIAMTGHDTRLLSRLQVFHDSSGDGPEFMSSFLKLCRDYAATHNLIMPELPK